MKDYPWGRNLSELVEFEKDNMEWTTDIPDLSQSEIQSLLDEHIIDEARISLYMLSHILDQKNVGSLQAEQAFSHMQSCYCEIISCFMALALCSNVSTQSLIWIVERLNFDADVLDHALGNLQKRAMNDEVARKWLEENGSSI